MRYLLWIIKFLVFLLLLSFAVKNADPVTVRYYLGHEWQVPLIFVLLVAFCTGAAIGVLACLGQLFRLRRELAALKSGAARNGLSRGDAETPRKLQNEFP